MWEILKYILTSDIGTFGFSLGLAILIGWGLINTGRIIERYKDILKKVKKLEKNSVRKKDFAKKITPIEENLNIIKENFLYIKASIDLTKKNTNSYTQTQSPINLNEKGKIVSKKLEAQKIINEVWDTIEKEIKNEIDKVKETNPYTLQEICFKICESYSAYFSPEDMNHIKNIAYNEGVSLHTFDLLFGIIVRNKYFEENKIITKDIDKYTPNKK